MQVHMRAVCRLIRHYNLKILLKSVKAARRKTVLLFLSRAEDIMIYIVYPVMLIILFWGCRIYGRKSWNEEFLSLEQTKALLGFAALCIMFHHIGQKNSASWIDRKYYTGGLEFFVPIGYVLVAFFTFCSGYGLYKSLKGKKNYLNFSFLRHHILTFVFLGYLLGHGLCGVVELGEGVSGSDVFRYAVADERLVHVFSERFYGREEYGSVLRDGVVEYVVEVSVGVRPVVVVESVGSHESDERLLFDLRLGYVGEVYACGVALEFHVEAEFVFLDG